MSTTRTPLETLIDRYMRARQDRGDIARRTAVRQRSILGTLADVFGRRPVERLSRRDIERWQATRATKSPGTRRSEWGIVRAFVRWLSREGHLRRDPMADMRAPAVPRAVPRALTREECDAIEAVLPDVRARAAFALMRRCGLRKAEVLRLEVGDWDRQAGVLTVRGKGGHQRLVAVPSDVATILAQQCDGFTAGPIIRRHDTGGPLGEVRLGKLMAEWMVSAGVKVRPWDGRGCHSLRHTIASEVADVTHDLRVVQELLGHQSLSTTQIYLRRATMGDQRRALEAAGEVVDVGRSSGLRVA